VPPRDDPQGRSGEVNNVKVTVDYDVCASTGSCMQVCPEVFEVRNDGYLYVLQEEPPEELRPKVVEAAELCPTGAITVED
jgi:ferredoxin